MYPRLFLARNLLEDDGVIFISIDDNEIQNLILLLNEIFGEENHISTLIWDKGHSAQAGIFKSYHEYILVYAKNHMLIDTPKSDNNDLFEAGAIKRESRRHALQEFNFPAGVRFDAPNGKELKGRWGGIEVVELYSGRMICEKGYTKYPVTLRAAFTQMNQMKEYFYGDKNNLIDSRGQKIVEFYFNSNGKLKIVKERGVFTPDTTLSDYGTQSNASTKLALLFGINETPINNPKPYSMIKDFISWFTEPDDLVIDFFAGSCPITQATYELIENGDSSRKFICVQYPEKLEKNKKEHKSGYEYCISQYLHPNIAEVGKERIRRSIKKVKSETPLLDQNTNDLGFRVFKLKQSNFKLWRGDGIANQNELEQQLDILAEPVRPEAMEENMLFELLLKSGYPLTTHIEKREVGSGHYYLVDGELAIALTHLDTVIVEDMLSTSPQQVICLDALFKDDDSLKTNTRLQLADAGIAFHSI
jgi:adenine-specific DNA-methyltransferase